MAVLSFEKISVSVKSTTSRKENEEPLKMATDVEHHPVWPHELFDIGMKLSLWQMLQVTNCSLWKESNYRQAAWNVCSICLTDPDTIFFAPENFYTHAVFSYMYGNAAGKFKLHQQVVHVHMLHHGRQATWLSVHSALMCVLSFGFCIQALTNKPAVSYSLKTKPKPPAIKCKHPTSQVSWLIQGWQSKLPVQSVTE